MTTDRQIKDWLTRSTSYDTINWRLEELISGKITHCKVFIIKEDVEEGVFCCIFEEKSPITCLSSMECRIYGDKMMTFQGDDDNIYSLSIDKS